MDDNIIKFPGTEDLLTDESFGPPVSLNDLLDAAKERDFDDVILIGTWKDKDFFYLASTSGNLPILNWNLDKAKQILITASLENMEN